MEKKNLIGVVNVSRKSLKQMNGNQNIIWEKKDVVSETRVSSRPALASCQLSKEPLGINTKFETKIYSITHLSPKKQHVTQTDDNRFQHQRYLIRAIYGTQNVVEFPKMWLGITGQQVSM